jgi:hypothetical protein
MSERRTDRVRDLSPSIEDARYWFDQYLQAAGWEARLIEDIRQLRLARRSPAATEAERPDQLLD